MTGLSSGAPTFLSGSTLAFIVLGSVLEGIPAIILFGQLLFPIAHQVGNHEVHYAMVVVLAMEFCFFAPPFGVGYYRRLRDQRHQPRPRMKPIAGYVIALLAGLILLARSPGSPSAFSEVTPTRRPARRRTSDLTGNESENVRDQ